MDRHKRIEIYKKAVERFGLPAQLNKLKEEIFELGLSIAHYETGKALIDEVVTEIADVEILLEQIKIHLLLNLNVEEEKVRKLKRLDALIDSSTK